jgi:hypothetical protein
VPLLYRAAGFASPRQGTCPASFAGVSVRPEQPGSSQPSFTTRRSKLSWHVPVRIGTIEEAWRRSPPGAVSWEVSRVGTGGLSSPDLGLAATSMLLVHADTDDISALAARILDEGYVGVLFMFVLSGFVLTQSYGDTARSRHVGCREYVALSEPVLNRPRY